MTTTEATKCETCKGQGWDLELAEEEGAEDVKVDCDDCNGTGTQEPMTGQELAASHDSYRAHHLAGFVHRNQCHGRCHWS